MNDRVREDWSLPRAVFRSIVTLIVRTALVFATAPSFAFRAVIFTFKRRDLFTWKLAPIRLPAKAAA